MRAVLVLTILFTSVGVASAYTRRESPSVRFDNDLRAQQESMRSRFSDRTNHIVIDNGRLRERLNGTGSPRLRELPRTD